MKKLEKKQIFGLAAIALGVVAVVKIVGDIRKIKKLTAEKEEAMFIRALAGKLSECPGCRYFTMHCTGTAQYETLKKEMGDAISYMGCGDSVEINARE